MHHPASLIQQFRTLGKCKGNEGQENGQACWLSLSSISSATAADRTLGQMGHWYDSAGFFLCYDYLKKVLPVCKSTALQQFNAIISSPLCCTHEKQTILSLLFLFSLSNCSSFNLRLQGTLPESLITLAAGLFTVFIILNCSIQKWMQLSS